MSGAKHAEPPAYIGSELELFEHAIRWKAYLGEQLAPFLHGTALEVGAGIGGTTPFLLNDSVDSWRCLEPDPALAAVTARHIGEGDLPSLCSSEVGTLCDVEPAQTLDSIVYIDVLEHIEDDRAELREAASRLRPGGHLVILAPAWNWLYSPFDAAIGHFRRYDRTSLSALQPPATQQARCRYLDSAGLLPSIGNRFLLRSASPTAAQVAAWDLHLVPVSRHVDRILRYRVGKSIMMVWRRNGP